MTPFGVLQATRVGLDDYVETGGPFPAAIDEIAHTARLTRVGLEGRYSVSPRLWLWSSAAWGHLFDASSSPVTGRLIGLFAVSGGAFPLRSDWAELAGGLSVGFGDTARLTASITALVPDRENYTVSARVGLSQGF